MIIKLNRLVADISPERTVVFLGAGGGGRIGGRPLCGEHMPHVAVIPGDGIGREVLDEGLKVLRALDARHGLNLRFTHLPYGADRYLATGLTITPEEMSGLRDYDAVYLGALGDPRVPSNVHAKDILLGMRFQLDLYINLRPCVLLDERYCPLKDRRPEDVRFTVFRENTEGLYTGIGGQFKRSWCL